MVNDKFLQLQGPFVAGEDLVDLIKRNYNSSLRYIQEVGIQSKYTHLVKINGQIFEISFREILDIDEARISSLVFMQDEDASTLIDCILA